MSTTYPEWLSATLASDATEGRQVVPPGWLHPLKTQNKIVAPAFVVQASQDDNLALVRALAADPPPSPGCVVVVAGMHTSKTATIGGLMALEISNLGICGLITDGLIRDAEEIRQLELAVWCRGTTPTASLKRNAGLTVSTVCLGGIMINAGDLVIADEDGIVIWPQAEITALLERAKAKFEADNVRLARLQQLRPNRA